MQRELPQSPFRLRFVRQDEVLRAEVAGESSLENTIAYWQAIVAEVRRERPRGLLLVDELHGTPLGDAQWRQLVEAIRSRGMEGVRIALAGNRKYVWGGETPQGFDCSGMQQFIYRFAGVHLPRTAAQQYEAGTPVEFAELQPGDLVFFSNGKRIFHVGMYIGNGKIFHAANPRRGLTTDSLSEPFYAKRFAGARRYHS